MNEEQINTESPKPKTSRLAILAFISGFVSLSSPVVGLGCLMFIPYTTSMSQWLGDVDGSITVYSFMFYAPVFFGIASLILCVSALIVIKRSKGKLTGKYLAIFGPALSIALFVCYAVFLVFMTIYNWLYPRNF